jgi:membrane protein YqaA with SNARE-associated domain
MNFIKNLYHWVLKWADSKYGGLALGVMALAEASFFPIPPDVLLIALCLGAQNKSFKFGLICSIGSIAGAIIGYGIGSFLWWSSPGTFTSLANFFFDIIPGFSTDVFYTIKDQYEEWNFWIVFTAGFTPIPFKIFTISAGAFDINFILFIIASTVSRTARFIIVCSLIWKYGKPIEKFIDNYFNLLALIFTLLLFGGFLLAKLLF